MKEVIKNKISLQVYKPIVALFFIFIINAIFSYTSIRIDITKNKIYSLSKGTKELLKKLEDNLFVDLYYSEQLPSQVTVNKDYTISILKDYAFYSRGKLKFSGIKIKTDDAQKRKQAIQEGISPVRFDVISKEKFEQTEGFLGLVIRYRDKKEVIPFISDISNLEYDLSSRINSMIKDKKTKIYFITDTGAISNWRLSQDVKNIISSNYDIEDTTLKDLYNSSETITACYIGPTSTLDEKAQFYFDQLLVKGSRIFVAYDKKYTSLESFFSRDNTINIEKTLEKNDIKIKNTLILDANSQIIQIGFRQGPFVITNIVKYPFFILTDNFNREHPTTRNVYSLTVPFASPIEFSTTSHLQITPIIWTSKKSWAKKENSYVSIYPFQEYKIENDDHKGPFVIALSAKGKFKSAFDKDLEIKEGKNKEILKVIKEGEKDSLLYLITSSKFIHQDNINSENIQYFLNILNYISQDDILLSIRTKKTGFIPLKEIKDIYKVFIKYANIFLPIIFLIALGIYRWKMKNTKIKQIISELSNN